MAAKSSATIQTEIAVAIAALDALKDSMDAEILNAEAGMYLTDSWQFQRAMSADCEKYSLQLTGYVTQCAARWGTA